MPPTGINAGEQGSKGTNYKKKLSNLIQDWKQLRNQIEKAPDQVYNNKGQTVPNPELDDLRNSREHLVNQIVAIARAHRLQDFAVDKGFRADLLKGDPGGSSGSPSGVNAGEGTARESRRRDPDRDRERDGDRDFHRRELRMERRERLKNFKLVRLPSGRVAAIRTINIKGNKVQWGVWVDKNDFDKYGVNEKQINPITRAQAKRLEMMGNADELIFRGDDKNEFKAIVRGISRAHKGTPVLDDDEVLGVIIAQTALNLTDQEVQGMLRQTKWYKRTTEHEQNWTFDYSPEKRREDLRNTRVRLIDELEDLYGLDWQKHFGKNAMGQVRDWAKRIASGELGGDPESGFNRWAANQADRAAKIEGTPEWVIAQQQAQAIAGQLNKPEEMFETLRSQALGYLGYDKDNTPRLSRDTLRTWARQIVTGEKSQADWSGFLRQQMKSLFPYFDPNIAFTDQADAYKSIAERTLGDTLDWNDKLLRDFAKTDENGKPLGSAMSLHDFEMKVRQDKRAWREGTALWDEGIGIIDGLLRTMRGVG